MIDDSHDFSFHNLMTRRIQKKENNIPWHVQDKVIGPKFFRQVGCRTPEVYAILNSPENINLDSYPDRFVIKPSMLSSSIGVRLLERQSNGYFDHMRQKSMTVEEIVDEQSERFHQVDRKNKHILVEELVVDESQEYTVPRDFKFYGSQGNIELILEMHRDSQTRAAAWYDGEFEPITDGRIVNDSKRIKDKLHDRPHRWREMLSVAKRLSIAVPTPFCSIDMYPSPAGPVIGEVTLTPGGLYYDKDFHMSEELQVRLALNWLDAERQLQGSNSSAEWFREGAARLTKLNQAGN